MIGFDNIPIIADGTTLNNDKINTLGTITRDAERFTFSIGFSWTINNFNFANTAPKEFFVPVATAGFYRSDIFYLSDSIFITHLIGQENNVIAIQPALPLNAILLSSISIFGEQISDVTNTDLGQNYVLKSFFKEIKIQNSNGTLALPTINGNTAFLFINGYNKAPTQTREFFGFIFTNAEAAKLYDGKTFTLKNSDIANITLVHNNGTVTIPFHFADGLNYTLQPTELLEFRYSIRGLELIGSNITQTLQKVITNGKTYTETDGTTQYDFKVASGLGSDKEINYSITTLATGVTDSWKFAKGIYKSLVKQTNAIFTEIGQYQSVIEMKLTNALGSIRFILQNKTGGSGNQIFRLQEDRIEDDTIFLAMAEYVITNRSIIAQKYTHYISQSGTLANIFTDGGSYLFGTGYTVYVASGSATVGGINYPLGTYLRRFLSASGMITQIISRPIDSTPISNSLNAVSSGGAFSALSQKMSRWQSAIDGVTIINTTTIGITYSQLIPANTFVDGDVVYVAFRFTSPAKTSVTIAYMYVNTSNVLAGATQLGTNSTLSINRTLQMDRFLSVKNETTKVFNTNTNSSTDTGLSPAMSTVNIDWKIDQYFIFAIGHTVADQTSFGDFYQITK